MYVYYKHIYRIIQLCPRSVHGNSLPRQDISGLFFMIQESLIKFTQHIRSCRIRSKNPHVKHMEDRRQIVEKKPQQLDTKSTVSTGKLLGWLIPIDSISKSQLNLFVFSQDELPCNGVLDPIFRPTQSTATKQYPPAPINTNLHTLFINQHQPTCFNSPISTNFPPS